MASKSGYILNPSLRPTEVEAFSLLDAANNLDLYGLLERGDLTSEAFENHPENRSRELPTLSSFTLGELESWAEVTAVLAQEEQDWTQVTDAAVAAFDRVQLAYIQRDFCEVDIYSRISSLQSLLEDDFYQLSLGERPRTSGSATVPGLRGWAELEADFEALETRTLDLLYEDRAAINRAIDILTEGEDEDEESPLSPEETGDFPDQLYPVPRSIENHLRRQATERRGPVSTLGGGDETAPVRRHPEDYRCALSEPCPDPPGHLLKVDALKRWATSALAQQSPLDLGYLVITQTAVGGHSGVYRDSLEQAQEHMLAATSSTDYVAGVWKVSDRALRAYWVSPEAVDEGSE